LFYSCIASNQQNVLGVQWIFRGKANHKFGGCCVVTFYACRIKIVVKMVFVRLFFGEGHKEYLGDSCPSSPVVRRVWSTCLDM